MAADDEKFDINESTGQITDQGGPLNRRGLRTDGNTTADDYRRTKVCTYTVKVKVRDGLDEDTETRRRRTTPNDTIDGKSRKINGPSATWTKLRLAPNGDGDVAH